jgi:hypothetical protein
MNDTTQIDWTKARRVSKSVVDADLIRFAEDHRRKTGKTIYPLCRNPDDDPKWQHSYDPREHPDRSLAKTKTGAYEPAPPLPAEPVSAVGKKIADALGRLRWMKAGSPMRQSSAPRKHRTRRDGDVTITEYGATKGLGPRRVRDALKTLGVLQEEIEVREVPMLSDPSRTKPEYRHVLRLTLEFVRDGLGRRLEPHGGGVPFDVLTPKGRKYLDQKVARKGNRRHLVRDHVRGLVTEGKTQAEIVRLTGLSKQLVSHHMRNAA